MSELVKINGRWPLVLPDSTASEWIGNMKFHNNQWELKRLEALRALISNGTIVYYVGAYKGDMAALLASWGAEVVIMESSPGFWPLIKETWELNPDLKPPLGCWSGLVSDKTIYNGVLPHLRQWPARQVPFIEGTTGFTHLAESSLDVDNFPQITIDDYAIESGIVPQIITVDVEGSELQVLQGAEKVITEYHPHFMLSVHPEFMFHNHGSYERELHDFLRSRGYVGKWLDYDHEHHWLYTWQEAGK